MTQPAEFPHRRHDLKPGDFFLSENPAGYMPVAFFYGEPEGKTEMVTRLMDGTMHDLFRLKPEAKIRIIDRADAIAHVQKERAK